MVKVPRPSDRGSSSRCWRPAYAHGDLPEPAAHPSADGAAGSRHQGEGASPMTTTAWRFSGTEGADAAVLRLKQLDSQGVMDVQDVAIIRWPQYASGPQVQEHVTDEGSRASSLAKRIKKAGIDGAMLEAVRDDITLGTS